MSSFHKICGGYNYDSLAEPAAILEKAGIAYEFVEELAKGHDGQPSNKVEFIYIQIRESDYESASAALYEKKYVVYGLPDKSVSFAEKLTDQVKLRKFKIVVFFVLSIVIALIILAILSVLLDWG